MSVRRIMGIETEYGVLEPGNPYANAMKLSSQVVLAYKEHLAAGHPAARWDYRGEDPLSDARGYHLLRAAAHPSLLTDDPERPAPSGDEVVPAGLQPQTPAARTATRSNYENPGSASAVLPNGARWYVDHAHPEYSSPEVSNPLDAVTWDAAGEIVALRAARLASEASGTEIRLYKNNGDGKGASYGTHENYLVERAVPFDTLVDVLTPFFVTRQIVVGSGRVGLGQHGEEPGFQLAQRADFMEAEVGLETTLRRPIINTRDEPHADPTRWRRLHVIIGDANTFQVATYLKLATTSLVLFVAEHLAELPGLAGTLVHLRLADPVGAVQQVSRDLTLRQELQLADGGRVTALAIQRAYLQVVQEALTLVGEQTGSRAADGLTADALALWNSVLDDLATDPALASDRVEWAAKLTLLDRLRQRENGRWDHPRVVAADIQWTDIDPARSLSARLKRAGAVRELVDPQAVAAAVDSPPDDTRAWLRGTLIRRFPDQILDAGWAAITLGPLAPTTLGEPAGGTRRIALPDPARATRELLGDAVEAAQDLDQVVAALDAAGSAAFSATA